MNHQVTILFTETQIQERISAMAKEMAPHLDREPVLIGVLKGALILTADLMRALSRLGIKPFVDFMVLSSYGKGTTSSGQVQVRMDQTMDLTGRQVLLLDDILDSGNTLAFAVRRLRDKGATQILTCVLLDKPARREVPFAADFVGFTIPDAFVVGYGIDYAEHHRELPHVGVRLETHGKE
ncbi:MAG: hypoxanthine phosphoribosyltransferase [Magnetococcales bacterium]|nr:hypoxanthine phosphoribosyltransferase [Magnetococcales bacterium]MBF0322955.1 hypoxanthine phosphoribosyltransferase [Magnetococcales bacterium]